MSLNTPVPLVSDPPLPSDPPPVMDAKSYAVFATMNTSIIEFNKAVRAIGLDHVASSASSNNISRGVKTFLIEAGKGYCKGMYVKFVAGVDVNQYMAGPVLDYDIGTGLVQIDVDDARGGGVYDEWVSSLAIQGSGGGASGGGITYLETTGTGSDYIADLTIPISQFKDGDVFNVKFHAACAANATIKISGINPALDLKIQASDGVFVNVAAGDITAGHQCLLRVAAGATMGIVEPAVALEVLNHVVADTTFNTQNALDQTVVSNGVRTHVMPLMGEFPVRGSFTVVNESGVCTINRQGLDNIKYNGIVVTSLTVPQGGAITFINRGTDWLAYGVAVSSLSNIVFWSTPGIYTFTTPNGIRRAKLTVGAGGNNGGNVTTGVISLVTAGDGGCGGISEGYLDLAPNTTYTVVVGDVAQASSFGSLMSATPGVVGQSVTGGTGVNGANGIGVGGQINLGGVAPGIPFFGLGFPGGVVSPGLNAVGFCAGGKGASRQAIGTSTGGTARPGFVKIEY